MSGLILPRRFKGQPQTASVDWGHPALQGVSSSIITLGGHHGWQRNLGRNIAQPTFSGTVGTRVTQHGPGLEFNAVDTVVEYGNENIPYLEFTLLWGGVIDTFTSFRGLFDYSAGANGWNIFQAGSSTLHFSINGYGGFLSSSSWPTGTFFHGALRNKSGGGCAWYRNGAKIASRSGATPTATTGTAVVGTQRGSGIKPWDGAINYFYLLDRYLSDDVIASIAVNPWQLFKAPARRLWAVASSGITLTGANSTQTNTGGAAAIIQTHALDGAASVQANAGGGGAITLGAVNTLVGATSTQDNTGGTGGIIQAQVLIAAASTNDGAFSAVAITQFQVLAGAAATQGNLGDTGAISILVPFVGAPSTQANVSGSGQITRTQTLTAVNSAQANPSGTGAISDGIVVEPALTTGIAATIRIKKPGIPSGTPEWLKTLLEILIGRRGNRIEVPKFRILTFSATPTKTECEALYSYTNTVRNSLEQLINRMDG